VKLMNSSLRKTTVLVAGALLGVAGAVAFAAPAAATGDHPKVVLDAYTDCDPRHGVWTVRWVLDKTSGGVGKVTKLDITPAGELAPYPNPTANIQLLKLDAEFKAKLGGVQTIPNAVATATVDAEVTFGGRRSGEEAVAYGGGHGNKEKKAGDKKTVNRPAKCDPPTTPPTSTSPSPTTTTPAPANTSSAPATPSVLPSTPAPGTGGGSQLPKTGAGTTSLIVGAIVLLAAGAGAFFLARRRRLKFTA
jgi:LPXTG-motif cell wall-anchored protein